MDDYRKFKIKTIDRSNDLAMLKEVFERRLRNNWPKPDLILIDGGENQLRVIQEIVERKKLEIPTVSIAKGKKRDKNEFYFSDASTAKYILNTPSIQKILIQARDESHRFAIKYYRTLHNKGLFN